jgi:beta-lactamase class A
MTLSEQIDQVIAASGAEMGVALRHLESGAEYLHDADGCYVLASVFKVPVLVEAFHQVSEGRLSLDERLTLRTADKNLPSGVLTFFEDGLTPTVRDLLTLMIIISDNTATDMVMHRLGPETINERLRTLGLENVHVSLSVRQIFDSMLPSSDPTQDLHQLEIEEHKAGPRKDSLAYQLTPQNNVGTPREMTRLLELIFTGLIPDRAAGDGALGILLQQQLNERLPRFLPPGVRVAHKTGTLSGVRNDAGILYARDDSHVAVTVFTRWDDQAVWDDPQARWRHTVAVDSAIGEIGRLAYEAFC